MLSGLCWRSIESVFGSSLGADDSVWFYVGLKTKLSESFLTYFIFLLVSQFKEQQKEFAKSEKWNF